MNFIALLYIILFCQYSWSGEQVDVLTEKTLSRLLVFDTFKYENGLFYIKIKPGPGGKIQYPGEKLSGDKYLDLPDGSIAVIPISVPFSVCRYNLSLLSIFQEDRYQIDKDFVYLTFLRTEDTRSFGADGSLLEERWVRRFPKLELDATAKQIPRIEISQSANK